MAVKCQASSLLGRLDLVALQLLPGDSRQKRAQAQATREGWQDGQCMSGVSPGNTATYSNWLVREPNLWRFEYVEILWLLCIPSVESKLSSEEFSTASAATPLQHTRIWEHITGRLRADKWGDNVTSATMRGDGCRTRHGGLKHTIKDLHCKSGVQGCYRVLVSLISWPGQHLSLNPCWRPKILASMLFLGILSLTVVIIEITAYLIKDCDYWWKL